MNYMADLIRDCSKARPTTFNEISFPIYQEIEQKIKNKNLGLRKKARSKIIDRQKLSKAEETKEENNGQPKKETILYNKIEREREQFNYMELYRDQRSLRENLNSTFPLQLDRLDDKDEEITFQIYLMIKKKKNIFKVEEVRRKLRNKEGGRRMNMRECECCGTIGKHKCKHIICLKKCEKYLRKQEKEVFYENEEPNNMIALAQEIIEGGTIKGPEIPIIEITVKKQKEENIVIPKIDKIEENQQKEEIPQVKQDLFEQSNEESEMLAPRQIQRISQNESNQLVSQGRKNKPEPELNKQAMVLQNVGEKQQMQQQIPANNPKQEEVQQEAYQQ